MEGVKGNCASLIELARQEKIVCLQETWLWTYESDTINNIIPNYDSFVRCDDLNENISNFQAPRGKAGVAILWPAKWSQYVKRLEDGNDRIIGIEMNLPDDDICIFNAYLPTLNLPSSKEKYDEHMDILHNIVQKYSATHKVILCGDMNGTLVPTRTNPHDIKLRSFVQEHGLTSSHNDNKPTFHGHGGGKSQIDYILSTDEKLVQKTKIPDHTATNLSSHVPIYADLNMEVPLLQKTNRNKQNVKPKYKMFWDRTDKGEYQDALLELINRMKTTNSADGYVKQLISALNKASRITVPRKVTKLNGPKFKLSPNVKELEYQCKLSHYEWKCAGSPGSEHPSTIRKKTAKYSVRKQIRREFATARDEFYNDILNNPTDKHFYTLIRRSQSITTRRTPSILVGGEDITDGTIQRNAFAAFYEDLSVPKDHPNFDEEFLTTTQLQLDLIQQINEHIMKDEPLVPFAEEEVGRAIRSLNSGKSQDESNLTAEHLKFAGPIVLPCIVTIFNMILETKTIPDVFKSGVLTPIHKKGKDARLVDNYRGITVTSVLGKLFEATILHRLKALNDNQSQLQYGFTKGLSPSLAALLLSEAAGESSHEGDPLYIATLDTQKAFDVVHHQVLMKKLYEQGISSHMWTIIQSMYSGLTAKVKWEGDISSAFSISQGVRQGGILSTHLYKTYINDLLLELEERNLGTDIGTTYIGCPTCADDVLLITRDPGELQTMLSLAYTYSQEMRYHIHPQKSTIIMKEPRRGTVSRLLEWHIGDTEIEPVESTTHLGLKRASKDENNINISDRISLARRTLYALMRTGVHGSNGLNPMVSYRIYRTYVIPRLLYNLEVLSLNMTQMKKLERFHIDILKKLQSLPQTATSAVLLLLGAIPIEAEIHKRQLSLLFTTINSKHDKLNELMYRQSIMGNENSFFCRVERTLAQYNLPPLNEISKGNYSKETWKSTTKAAVESYWTNELSNVAHEKSTLKNCNVKSLEVGKSHLVWKAVNSNTTDVKRGIIKARMLTGTYLLQTNKAKFNKYEVDATCPLCRLEPEDISHMLTRCPALHQSRVNAITDLRQYITEHHGPVGWSAVSSRSALTSLIIDCGTMQNQDVLPLTHQDETAIESITRRLCYKLHVNRLQKYKQLN
ncbi:MAG: reverse transcriptase domain-containing protein [Sedimenticola sp.]